MTYNLSLTTTRTYLYSALFIVGNIILPQLCHLVPQGGLIFLPIYFFTLIAAYKYGIATGIITAVFSPLLNHMLFGMPPMPVLPILLVKSVLLAVIAASVAKRLGRVTLLGVAIAVVGYQLLGSMAEWAMTGSIDAALQDLRLGYPGILAQIFLGHLALSKFHA